MRSVYAFLFLISLSFGLKSQTDSIQKPLDKTNSYFSFNYDNDFFSATDRYYTQGVYLEYIAPFLRNSIPARILPKLKHSNQNYYGIIAEQDCFTPGSIRYDTLNYLDRPYAATMYVSQVLYSINEQKKMRLNSRTDIGMIGPCAICEDEQKAIHRSLVNIQPLGWENQLSTDLFLNYGIGLEKGIVNTKYFETILNSYARFGTAYNDISAGIMVRGGLMAGYFKQLGIIKNAVRNKFQLYAFAKGKVRAVAYNAPIQGGMMSPDIHALPYSSVKPLVLQGTYGIVFAYKQFSAEYTKVYQSTEFLNGRDHGWGHCNITFCF